MWKCSRCHPTQDFGNTGWRWRAMLKTFPFQEKSHSLSHGVTSLIDLHWLGTKGTVSLNVVQSVLYPSSCRVNWSIRSGYKGHKSCTRIALGKGRVSYVVHTCRIQHCRWVTIPEKDWSVTNCVQRFHTLLCSVTLDLTLPSNFVPVATLLEEIANFSSLWSLQILLFKVTSINLSVVVHVSNMKQWFSYDIRGSYCWTIQHRIGLCSIMCSGPELGAKIAISTIKQAWAYRFHHGSDVTLIKSSLIQSWQSRCKPIFLSTLNSASRQRMLLLESPYTRQLVA